QRYRWLNEDGKIIQYKFPDLGVLFLKKCSIDKNQQILLIYNKNWRNSNQIDIPDLRKYMDYSATIFQIDLNGKKTEISDFHLNHDLKPNEFFLYFQSKEENILEKEPVTKKKIEVQ
ncbi:MAG: hypothetical protein KAJ10_15585, partial [Thermodesulfovibrionia bacterium]|nr:hypothetical protein [Thermodesulfovibrionia bacterium]